MFEQVTIQREIYGKGINRLLQADSSQPQQALAELAGTAQVVYIDPPFMTGDVFTRRRRFGEKGWQTGTPSIEMPAYSDRFENRQAYLTMLRGLIENAWLLLHNTGVLCLHLDWRSAAYARILCDDVFGEERFINEIIWAYESGGRAKKYFSRKHDVILLYAKSRHYHFDMTQVPLDRNQTRKNHLKRSVDEEGRPYRSVIVSGKEYRYYDDDPVYPGDVWTDIGHLQQRDPERTGYATQKPLRLLDRLLRPLVRPGDLVVDLCCGSGTTLEAAARLNCRYLGLDAIVESLSVSAHRLSSPHLVMDAPSSASPAEFQATFDPYNGLAAIHAMTIQHPNMPKQIGALDALESWAIGRLMGDELHVEHVFRRTTKQGALTPMCLLTPGEGTPALLTVDATGVRRVYRWRPDDKEIPHP